MQMKAWAKVNLLRRRLVRGFDKKPFFSGSDTAFDFIAKVI